MKMGDNIIDAKGSYPDYVVDILMIIKDHIKMGSILIWSPMEIIEHRDHERRER